MPSINGNHCVQTHTKTNRQFSTIILELYYVEFRKKNYNRITSFVRFSLFSVSPARVYPFHAPFYIYVVEGIRRIIRCDVGLRNQKRRRGPGVLHSCRGSEYLYAAVFGGGRAKGTLKILQELLNHGGLVAVVRAGITYLTSKCPAGAGSSFRILFHDRTLNHASVAAL